jgi:hypothetical protein
MDDDDDESIPLVATELVLPTMMTSPPSPFDDLLERFGTDANAPAPISAPAPPAAPEPPPAALSSAPPTLTNLPNPFASLPQQSPAPAPTPAPAPPPLPSVSIEIPLPAMENTTGRPDERRAVDGLVREVTLPLNLSLEELKRHRKLKLKITIDVNLLP